MQLTRSLRNRSIAVPRNVQFPSGVMRRLVNSKQLGSRSNDELRDPEIDRVSDKIEACESRARKKEQSTSRDTRSRLTAHAASQTKCNSRFGLGNRASLTVILHNYDLEDARRNSLDEIDLESGGADKFSRNRRGTCIFRRTESRFIFTRGTFLPVV